MATLISTQSALTTAFTTGGDYELAPGTYIMPSVYTCPATLILRNQTGQPENSAIVSWGESATNWTNNGDGNWFCQLSPSRTTMVLGVRHGLDVYTPAVSTGTGNALDPAPLTVFSRGEVPSVANLFSGFGAEPTQLIVNNASGAAINRYFHGTSMLNWATSLRRITAVSGTTITVSGQWIYHWGPDAYGRAGHGQFVNALTFLTQPGTYFYDETAKRLWVRPKTGVTWSPTTQAFASRLAANYMLTLNGSNSIISGISFRDYQAAAFQGGGVNNANYGLRLNANNILIQKCLFSNHARAILTTTPGGTNADILDNTFQDGFGGFIRSEGADALIQGNFMFRFGSFDAFGGAGVDLRGANQLVRKNWLQDFSRYGVASFSVNFSSGNVIEKNVFWNGMLSTYDGGAVYTIAGSAFYAQPPGFVRPICRWNYFRDIKGHHYFVQKTTGSPNTASGSPSERYYDNYYAFGFYADEDMSYWDVIGNIFDGCAQAGFYHNKGSSFLFRYNIVQNITSTFNQEMPWNPLGINPPRTPNDTYVGGSTASHWASNGVPNSSQRYEWNAFGGTPRFPSQYGTGMVSGAVVNQNCTLHPSRRAGDIGADPLILRNAEGWITGVASNSPLKTTAGINWTDPPVDDMGPAGLTGQPPEPPPPSLQYSAPAQSSPRVINVPSGGGTFPASPTEDISLVMPITTATGTIRLDGGRHVRVIGGAVSNATAGQNCMEFVNQTGSIFIEGLLVDKANQTGSGIFVSTDSTTTFPDLCIQNTHIRGITGSSSRAITIGSRIRRYLTDKVTIVTSSEGVRLPTSFHGTNNYSITLAVLNRTNAHLEGLASSGTLFALKTLDAQSFNPTNLNVINAVDDAGEITLANLLFPAVTVSGSPSVASFNHTLVSGGITSGNPSGGDWAPSSSVGLVYVSPNLYTEPFPTEPPPPSGVLIDPSVILFPHPDLILAQDFMVGGRIIADIMREAAIAVGWDTSQYPWPQDFPPTATTGVAFNGTLLNTPNDVVAQAAFTDPDSDGVFTGNLFWNKHGWLVRTTFSSTPSNPLDTADQTHGTINVNVVGECHVRDCLIAAASERGWSTNPADWAADFPHTLTPTIKGVGVDGVWHDSDLNVISSTSALLWWKGALTGGQSHHWTLNITVSQPPPGNPLDSADVVHGLLNIILPVAPTLRDILAAAAASQGWSTTPADWATDFPHTESPAKGAAVNKIWYDTDTAPVALNSNDLWWKGALTGGQSHRWSLQITVIPPPGGPEQPPFKYMLLPEGSGFKIYIKDDADYTEVGTLKLDLGQPIDIDLYEFNRLEDAKMRWKGELYDIGDALLKGHLKITKPS